MYHKLNKRQALYQFSSILNPHLFKTPWVKRIYSLKLLHIVMPEHLRHVHKLPVVGVRYNLNIQKCKRDILCAAAKNESLEQWLFCQWKQSTQNSKSNDVRYRCVHQETKNAFQWILIQTPWTRPSWTTQFRNSSVIKFSVLREDLGTVPWHVLNG